MQRKLYFITVHSSRYNENSSEEICVMLSIHCCSGSILLPNHDVPLMLRKPEKDIMPVQLISDAIMTYDESCTNTHSIFHDEENVNVSTTMARCNIDDFSDGTYADCEATPYSKDKHIAGTFSLTACRPLNSELTNGLYCE
ncbi:hypothetical protein ACJMK2_027785 [Sinanodonta woodiana]|uniref:Uncharacterized protein n=1 Tax=Sinanodonta woodiana TaxID=1069815 RepID=A0ABD3X8L3_SINWO